MFRRKIKNGELKQKSDEADQLYEKMKQDFVVKTGKLEKLRRALRERLVFGDEEITNPGIPLIQMKVRK